MSNILKFSTDWNNKLDCRYFTTMRLSNRWSNYDTVLVEYRGKYRVAKVVDRKALKISDLNEWICAIDTGYSKDETVDIIKKMYKHIEFTPSTCVNWYLIKCITGWITLPEANDILG